MNQRFICIIYLVAVNGCGKKIFPLLFDSFPLFVSQLMNKKSPPTNSLTDKHLAL